MIQFGTDGWRALTDSDFNPENIQRVILAFCDWQKNLSNENKTIYVGYDQRASSKESAKLVSQVLITQGFYPILSSSFCPTPCVSWMVKHHKALAGIMITASHNPWQWNGIKFKESYGGSASPSYTQKIQDHLPKPSGGRINQLAPNQKIAFFDPKKEYLEQIKSLIDVKAIQKSKFKVVHDSIHGAGAGYIKTIVGDSCKELRESFDPKFGGVNPEPIEKNLKTLKDELNQGSFDLGLATDGDADRIGAMNAEGKFIDAHHIFALLLMHYVENKNMRGAIIKSVSTTQMIDRLAKLYGLQVIETPIGFKHICQELLANPDALMGGEESGGISFSPHVHERDGILNGLFLLEMMAKQNASLNELIDQLYQKVGAHFYQRDDLHLTDEQMQNFANLSRSNQIPSPDLGKLKMLQKVDGLKWILEDASWLLIRASGTEPLVRIYSESQKQETVKKLIKWGHELVLG